MDMHRAFQVAENLMFDDALQGLAYVGIGYDYKVREANSQDQGYVIELFTEANEERLTPNFVIKTEADVDKFWSTLNDDFRHGDPSGEYIAVVQQCIAEGRIPPTFSQWSVDNTL